MTLLWRYITINASLGSLFALCVFGQVHPQDAAAAARVNRIAALSANRSKLTGTLKLDREVYFPAEDAEIKLRIVNSTTEVLEVPTPFDPMTGEVTLMVRNGRRYPELDKSEWVRAFGEPDVVVASTIIPPLPPTMWLPPGQPMEKSLRISDTPCGPGTILGGLCGVPEKEGEYRLVYTYIGMTAFADFRVEYPRLERWTEVILAKPHEWEEIGVDSRPTGRTIVRPRRVRAAVLEHESQHIVVVAAWHAPSDGLVDLDPNGLFGWYQGRQFGPYRRVATTTETITSLRIEADQADRINLSWTNPGRATRVVRLDAKHNPIE